MVVGQEAIEATEDHCTSKCSQKMGDGFRDECEPKQRCASTRGAVYWKNSLTFVVRGSGRGAMGGAQGDPPETHNVISYNTVIERDKVAKSSTINAEASNAETSKDAP